jgi:hypothetical protein
MGGLVISLKHENVAQALISFAKEYGITHVVLDKIAFDGPIGPEIAGSPSSGKLESLLRPLL